MSESGESGRLVEGLRTGLGFFAGEREPFNHTNRS